MMQDLVFPAEHGFCDPFAQSYNAAQATIAEQASENFIVSLTGRDSISPHIKK